MNIIKSVQTCPIDTKNEIYCPVHSQARFFKCQPGVAGSKCVYALLT